MSHFTRVCLVLLRLAIGWQILVEGVEKLGTVEQIGWVHLGANALHFGPPRDRRPWSSEAYLRESNGPVSGYFHRYVLGDPRLGGPDEVLIKHLKAENGAFPAPLEEEWDYYFRRFVEHYGLDEAQRGRAEEILAQRKAQTLRGLQGSEKKVVKRTFPSGTVEVERTVPERLADFEAKIREIHELEAQQWTMQHDVAREKLARAKADYQRMHDGLQSDLDAQTAAMRSALTGDLAGKNKKPAAPEELLSAEQRALGPVPEPTRKREGDWLNWAYNSWLGLSDRPVAKPMVPFSLQHIDWVTKWGLTLIGLCLLLGFFSRSACVGGFCFLMLFYLAMPPFPWLAAAPNNEGHYLFVNKTLIEAIALLTLATTRSAVWFGVDGLLRLLNPWRWRRRRRMTLDSIAARPAVGDVVAVSRPSRPMAR